MGKPIVQPAGVSDWNSCPYCDSDQLDGGPVDIQSTEAVQTVDCTACGKRWNEVYVASYRELPVDLAGRR